MTSTIIASLLLLTAVCTYGAEAVINKPTPPQVATVLGVDKGRVSVDDKRQQPKLEKKVLWYASYQITGDPACDITITVLPIFQPNRDLTKGPKGNFSWGNLQRIIKDDGDVIHHVRDDNGTLYRTTLYNHENDWDIVITISCKPDVDKSKLPVQIAKDGIKLVNRIETLLRK